MCVVLVVGLICLRKSSALWYFWLDDVVCAHAHAFCVVAVCIVMLLASVTAAGLLMILMRLLLLKRGLHVPATLVGHCMVVQG